MYKMLRYAYEDSELSSSSILDFEYPKYKDAMSFKRLKQILSEIYVLQAKVNEEKRVRTTLEATLSVLSVPIPVLPEEECSQEEQLQSEVDWLRSELKALRHHLTLLEIKSIDTQRTLQSESKCKSFWKSSPNPRNSLEMLSDLQCQMQEEMRRMSVLREMEMKQNNEMENFLIEEQLEKIQRETRFHDSYSNLAEDDKPHWPSDYSFDFWAPNVLESTDNVDDDFTTPNYVEFHNPRNEMRSSPTRLAQVLSENAEIPFEISPQQYNFSDTLRDSEHEIDFDHYGTRPDEDCVEEPSYENELYYVQKTWDSNSDSDFCKYEDKSMIELESNGLGSFAGTDDKNYMDLKSNAIKSSIFEFSDEDNFKNAIIDGGDFDDFGNSYGFEKVEHNSQEGYDNIDQSSNYDTGFRKASNFGLHRNYVHIRNPTPFEIPAIDMKNFKSPTVSQPISEDDLTSENVYATNLNTSTKTSDDSYGEALCSISEKMVEVMASIYENHVYQQAQKENSKNKPAKKSPQHSLRFSKLIGKINKKKNKNLPASDSPSTLSSWYSLSSRMKFFKVPASENSSTAASPTKEIFVPSKRNCNFSDSETDSTKTTETDSEFWSFEDTMSACSVSPSMEVYQNLSMIWAGGDPYGISKGKDELDLGSYESLLECSSVPLQANKHAYDSIMIKKFETLIRELEFLDPSKLNHEERLAFWINIYNSILMHAYIVKGCPTGYSKRISLMGKTSVKIGGHLINALDIEYGILRAHSHLSSMAKTLKVRLSPTDIRSTWTLTKAEPYVTFALCPGTRSGPKLQIYNPIDVENQIENAKNDFLRAAVGLNRSNKLWIPKLLVWYGPDFSTQEKLIDWILGQLPVQKSTVIVDRLCQYKRFSQSLCIEFYPYDWGFRYLMEPRMKCKDTNVFK